jgi:hypothetical protein
MPHQPYFVVVLAHSLHGRLRRIHIPHKVIYAGFVLSVVGCVVMLAFLSSYLRISWKVAHYNSLRQEVDSLRAKYQELQRLTNQKNEQLATLENFAGEVSVAYGLKRKPGTSSDLATGSSLAPTSASRSTTTISSRPRPSRRFITIIPSSGKPIFGPVCGRWKGGS